MSVWLPLIQRALLISRISGEGQMPRQNRLEVTPPPAHAHAGPNKGSDHSSGCQWKRGYKSGIMLCFKEGKTSHTHDKHQHTATLKPASACPCAISPFWP